MAQIFKSGEGTKLDLAGRQSLEIISEEICASECTVRLVEIPVSMQDEKPRIPHCHIDFEECIYVMSGHGVSFVDGEERPVETGDMILINSGEWHYTRNAGNQPLKLLCFFPVGDISIGTLNTKAE